jgi:hypothetical protein
LTSTKRHEWVHKVARVGYATKGAVYVLFGALSLDAALSGAPPPSNTGAVREIGSLPLGSVLLGVTALGLSGYALWRLVQALFDADGEGSRFKGIAARAGHVCSAVFHAALAFLALKLACGQGGPRGDGTKHWIAKLMSEPFGKPLVFAVGAGLVIFAILQIARALSGRFLKNLDHRRMTAKERDYTLKLGRLGLSARAVVFALMGFFIARAALDMNPNEAKSMGQVLGHVQASSHGPIFLAAVALGLMCYGAFFFVCAHFRRIRRV